MQPSGNWLILYHKRDHQGVFPCFVFNETLFSNLFQDFKLNVKFPKTCIREGKTIFNHVLANGTEKNVQKTSVFYPWGHFPHEDLRTIEKCQIHVSLS